MIIEQARKALERYEYARQEFEKVQKLAQVRGLALSTMYIPPLKQNKVVKNHSQRSQKPMEAIPATHFRPSQSPVLLSTQRTRLSWRFASES